MGVTTHWKIDSNQIPIIQCVVHTSMRCNWCIDMCFHTSMHRYDIHTSHIDGLHRYVIHIWITHLCLCWVGCIDMWSTHLILYHGQWLVVVTNHWPWLVVVVWYHTSGGYQVKIVWVPYPYKSLTGGGYLCFCFSFCSKQRLVLVILFPFAAENNESHTFAWL